MEIKAFTFAKRLIAWGADEEEARISLQEKLDSVDQDGDVLVSDNWDCEGETDEFEPIDLN